MYKIRKVSKKNDSPPKATNNNYHALLTKNRNSMKRASTNDEIEMKKEIIENKLQFNKELFKKPDIVEENKETPTKLSLHFRKFTVLSFENNKKIS